MSQKIEDFIKKNPPMNPGDYDKIAKTLNTSVDAVIYSCRKNGLTISKNNPGYRDKKQKHKVEKQSVPEYVGQVLQGIDEKTVKVFKNIPKPKLESGTGDEEELSLIHI